MTLTAALIIVNLALWAGIVAAELRAHRQRRDHDDHIDEIRTYLEALGETASRREHPSTQEHRRP